MIDIWRSKGIWKTACWYVGVINALHLSFRLKQAATPHSCYAHTHLSLPLPLSPGRLAGYQVSTSVMTSGVTLPQARLADDEL